MIYLFFPFCVILSTNKGDLEMKKGKLEFQIGQKMFSYQGKELNEMLMILSRTEGISVEEALCLLIDRTLDYYGDALSKIRLEELNLKEIEWKNHTHGKELELHHCQLSSTNYFYGFDSVLMEDCSVSSLGRNSLGIFADDIVLTKCNIEESSSGTYVSLLGQTIHLANSNLQGSDLHIRADQVLLANHTNLGQQSARLHTPMLCLSNSSLSVGLLEWDVKEVGKPLEKGNISAYEVQYQGVPLICEDENSFEYFVNLRSDAYQKMLGKGK